MRALPLRSIWQIVSEINLAEIQREIESTFHLLIAADDGTVAERAASSLSSPAADFVHPWITFTDGAGSGLRSDSTAIAPHAKDPKGPPANAPRTTPDCALLVTTQLELSADLASLLQALNAQSIPSLIVVIGPEGQKTGANIARRGEQARVVVPDWSARAVALVAAALVEIAPAELRLPLARRLPPLRPPTFHLLIQETSQANASYSFTTGLGEAVPGLGFVLGAGDAIVLTKNQLMMAYKIALVSGKKGSPQQLLGEIAGVLGGGFLFRQLARQMSGLIPVVGIVPKVAVSYAGTWAIGRAVVLWATEGRKITPELMKGFYHEALTQGRQAAHRIAQNSRRPRLSDKKQPSPPRKPAAPPSLLRQIRKHIARRSPRND